MDLEMPMHSKKFPLLILAVILMLLQGVALSAVTQAQAEVTVRAYRTVNVRSGPSTAYPVIGQLSVDSVAQVTGRSDTENNWLRIDFDGRPGWVAYFTVSVEGNASDLPVVGAEPTSAGITIINTPTQSPSAAEAAQPYVTSFRRVNVRSGPSTDYERVSTLHAGETGLIIGRTEDNQWLRVDINGQVGWVAFFVVSVTGELETIPVFIAPTMTPSPSATPTPTPIIPTETPLVVTITTRFNTNLRESPSFTSDVVAVVPYDTTLEVEARTDDSEWLRVTYEGKTGWLLAALNQLPSTRLVERLEVEQTIEATEEAGDN
jgi:uncharacterized protein YraI